VFGVGEEVIDSRKNRYETLHSPRVEFLQAATRKRLSTLQNALHKAHDVDEVTVLGREVFDSGGRFFTLGQIQGALNVYLIENLYLLIFNFNFRNSQLTY
jgi:hypothetical protein